MNERKIILREEQSPGDILTMSRAVYDLCRAYPDWQIDVHSACPDLFENSPFITKLEQSESDVEVYTITYDDINKSGWDGLHFSDAFRNDIERKLNDLHIFSFSIPLPRVDDLGKVKEYVKSAFQKQWHPLVEDDILQVKPREGDDYVWHLFQGDTLYSLVGKADNKKVNIEVYIHDDRQSDPVQIPKTGLYPELFFSDEELSWYNQVHCTYYWDGPFWLLNAGMKSDNELKQYHRWQEVVDILNDVWQGRVRIVQIGSKSAGGMSHIHRPLRGVFSLVGQTTTRELLRLAYWSDGLIGPISFQFVIGASEFKNTKEEVLRRYKPNVVVAGGKEGLRWHVYNHVRWLNKNGCLPCAESDGCWLGGKKGKCRNLIKPDDMDETVPLCFELTTPEEIAQAVLDHYNGSRLELPEEQEWHIPEGENPERHIEKYENCYREGIIPEIVTFG